MSARRNASKPDGVLHLNVNAPGGLPLVVAGYILRALGTAYPGTVIDTTGETERMFGGNGLALRIPASDYLQDIEVTDEQLAELTFEKDEPAMVAFTSGFKDGSLSVGPPPWLSTLLLTTAESLDEDILGNAPNYMSMQLVPEDGGEPFTWIVCRRGRPSPHELRREAEDRVKVLEQQLRDAGITPRRRSRKKK